MHPHRNRIRRTTRQSQSIPNHSFRINILNPIEPLQQPHKHIPSLRKCKLLPDTNARPAVERNVIPPGLLALPALGAELFCVGTPDVLAAVQDVHVVAYRFALADVDGEGAIGAAAAWDRGIADGGAAVHGDDGVEAEGFVEDVLEGLAGFKTGEGDGVGTVVGAEGFDDGLAEFVEDGGVASEEEDGPAEEGGGCVAAGEKDVEELGAQFDGVLGCGGEGVQEDVGAGFLFIHQAVFLVAHHVQRRLHEAVDKRVHLRRRVLRFLAVHQPMQFLEPSPLRTEPLRLVKVERKLVVNAVLDRGRLALDTLAEQELGSRVDGEPEEDGLDIGVASPARRIDRQGHHGFLHMAFLQIQLTDLIPGELRSKQASRPGPFLAIGRELYSSVSTCRDDDMINIQSPSPTTDANSSGATPPAQSP